MEFIDVSKKKFPNWAGFRYWTKKTYGPITVIKRDPKSHARCDRWIVREENSGREYVQNAFGFEQIAAGNRSMGNPMKTPAEVAASDRRFSKAWDRSIAKAKRTQRPRKTRM
mgnify:CR=1 FL=1